MSRREYAFLKSALVFTRMEGFEVTEQTVSTLPIARLSAIFCLLTRTIGQVTSAWCMALTRAYNSNYNKIMGHIRFDGSWPWRVPTVVPKRKA